MNPRRLMQPWTARRAGACLPGSVLLKLALGEAPEPVPTTRDVRRGAQSPSASLDGGPIDRMVRSLVGTGRYTRVHGAAASARLLGAGHRGFDDAEHILGLSRTFRLDFEPGASIGVMLDSMTQLNSVESASPNFLCTLPFDSGHVARGQSDADTMWDARDLIRASEALGYEPGDPTVIVAVVDSGVNLNHAELRERMRPGYDTVQLGNEDFALGIELLGDSGRPDTNPTDRFVGHGCACSAIIGAAGRAMPPGLAGDAMLLPIRSLGAARLPGIGEPVGIGALSDLDAGMKLAVDLGAKIINASFGTEDSALDPADPKPHADVMQYALERGCVIIAASGNSGDDKIYWPAAYDGVIAVSACDNIGHPTSFSSFGPHVALAAPGNRVLTAAIEGYQFATGTSFAAPFVAGAAALLIARAQRRSYPLEGSAVKRLLQSSAHPFPGGGTVRGYGSGVLDAYEAIRTLDAEIDRTATSETDSDET